MLRAVPAIMRMAASSLLALRSAVLILMISRICFFVTLPTLSTWPAASLAGGLQELRSRRRLENEGEGFVGVDRDYDRNDHSILVLGLRVKLLAEAHDVDALGAEGGTDRGRRIGGTGGELETDVTLNFLSHGGGSLNDD